MLTLLLIQLTEYTDWLPTVGTRKADWTIIHEAAVSEHPLAFLSLLGKNCIIFAGPYLFVQSVI